MAPDSPTPGRRTDLWVVVALVALAVFIRAAQTAVSGGLQGLYGYDDGVYFAATIAFVSGLMPYEDFVLLHPPGIIELASGPVWALQALGWSDSGVLAAVRVGFIALGAVNTALMYFAGRHLSRTAGIVAASLYAVWLPAVRVERSILLEPLVVTGVLVALVWLTPVSNRPMPHSRWVALAGVIGGAAVAVKLWTAIPLAVIVLAVLLARQWRRAAVYCAAAAVTLTAMMLPFVLAGPQRFWDLVITAQIGRPAASIPRVDRLIGMLNVTTWPLSMTRQGMSVPTSPAIPLEGVDAISTLSSGRHMAVLLAVLVVLASVLVAVLVPVARLWVALLAVQTAVLMVTPVFFPNYASFVAPALLLVAGAFGHLLWRWAGGSRALHGALIALQVCLVAAFGWGAAWTTLGERMQPEVRAVVAGARCVASDSMTAIAVADATTRNFGNGCMPVVDYSGLVYVMDYPKSAQASPSLLREASPEFQAFARAYFGEAEYAILRRAGGTGLSRQTLRELRQRPQVVSGQPVVVFGP